MEGHLPSLHQFHLQQVYLYDRLSNAERYLHVPLLLNLDLMFCLTARTCKKETSNKCDYAHAVKLLEHDITVAVEILMKKT
jgi:hypothetical protein